MTDRPRTDQEQWVAEMLRLLGFDVKMNYWPRGMPHGFEIDVWGRLGCLQVAVECKKYSREAVGAPEIEYFHEKLQMLGQDPGRLALGIFVANSYSEHDLSICRRHGILPLTSEFVLDEIERQTQDRQTRKHLAISATTWQLLSALMRIAEDWQSYYNPDWPLHTEIAATGAFESHGLILTKRGGFGDFQYEHTEAGKSFFGHMSYLLRTLQDANVTAMTRPRPAATLVVSVCGKPLQPSLFQGVDCLLIQGMGLQSADGVPTPFSDVLVSILEEMVLQSDVSKQ